MKKPKTEIEWSKYRVESSCKIAKDVLNGKIIAPANPLDYAVFSLAHAIQELATLITLTK